MEGDSRRQILQIEPSSELKFCGPFDRTSQANIVLTNPSEYSVCFKVKTTAPKQYCVRPNSGYIEPKKSFDVAVMLQPLNSEVNEKIKHKFMIQSMVLPDKYDNMEQIWKDAKQTDIMDSKLKCLFVQADAGDTKMSDSQVTHEVVNDTQKSDMSKKIEELKLENQKLKSNEVRLRQIAMESKPSTGNSEPQIISTRGISDTTSWLHFASIILALSMFLLGIVIGKFI